MFSNSAEFTSATNALFASQITCFQALSSAAVEGAGKVIALNMAATKASVEESIALAKQLTSAKDPQEFLSLTAAQTQQATEKMTSYGRQLTEIVSGIRDEFTKATERQFAETQSTVNALVGEVAKQALETVEAQVFNATEQVSSAVEKSTHKAAKK